MVTILQTLSPSQRKVEYIEGEGGVSVNSLYLDLWGRSMNFNDHAINFLKIVFIFTDILCLVRLLFSFVYTAVQLMGS